MTHAYALDDAGRYTGPCLAPASSTVWRWLRGERHHFSGGQMWRPVPGLPPKGSRKFGGDVPHVPVRENEPDDLVYRQAFCMTPPPWKDDSWYVLVMAGSEPGYNRTAYVREDHPSLAVLMEVPRSLPDLREWMSGRTLSGLVFVDGDGRRWIVEAGKL